MKFIKKFLKFVLFTLSAVLLSLVVYVFVLFITFNPEDIRFNYYKDDKNIPINLGNISNYCIKSIVSIEDKDFWNNIGVDFNGTLRLVLSVIGNEIESGGSTISQQLIKNFKGNFFERNFFNKIEEIILSIKLNLTISKIVILEKYLNNIYFGNYNYGIEAASLDYFKKSSSGLNLSECAYLMGIPQLPEIYNPYKNINIGLKRQKEVLDSLLRQNIITLNEYENALEYNLDF